MASQTKLIREEDIDEYLRNNPDYFVPRDQLLLELKIPHHSGGAISLLEKQITLLRKQHSSLKDDMDSAVEIAREHEAISQKIKHITLQLLDLDSLESLVTFLDDYLCQTFSAETFHLLLNKQVSNHNLDPYISPLKKSALDTETRNILRTGQPQVIKPKESMLKDLFPSAKSMTFKQVAILPLGVDGSVGLISLGGESIGALDDSKQLNFMSYLGNLLVRLMPKLSKRAD